MATDYKLLVYARLLALMQEGDTNALVRRWVVFNGTNPQPVPYINPQPADLPRITFDLESVGNDSFLSQMRTFAEHVQSTVRHELVTYKAKISLDNSALTKMTQILSAIGQDLANGGHRDLGIDGCTAEIQPLAFRNRRTKQDDEVPGHLRRVGELMIPVRITYLAESEF